MKEPHVSESLKCEDCGKVCRGIQGIRGHRRGCPGRSTAPVNQVQEVEETVVEPGKPRVPALNQQQTLGSRLNTEAVAIILRTYEVVRALREQLRDSLPIRQLLDSDARVNGWPSSDDWYELGRNVASVEVSLEQILQQAHVSRDEPWALHQLAISVRDQWISWRREEAYRAWRKAECNKSADNDKSQPSLDDVYTQFGIDDLQAEWNKVIDGLRWLTAHTKATL